MQGIFDSHSTDYRYPFGAVVSGAPVDFTIRPERGLAVSNAVLEVNYEFTLGKFELHMEWCGLIDGRDVFRARLFTDGYSGPAWYTFRLERYDQPTLYVGKPENGMSYGKLYDYRDCPAFQVSVFSKDYYVPDWYGRGITYHIFPDRFRRLKVPSAEGMIGDRTVHDDWYDVPDYKPDKNGEIRNNDFFGGSLEGVASKLDYLKSLGVGTLYFSPIFEAASNHRYDTGDYEKLDPMFGTNEEFEKFCQKARSMGMRVLLDGVFNHTGFDSVYFNGRGSYDSVGAYQSKDSPYAGWYSFEEWPDKYSSWWGIYTLPQVNETDEGYISFITDSKNSVARQWIRRGASGWRLDVADELPGYFLENLRAAIRQEDPKAILIGEVWEDASNKVSYDQRRRYFAGRELDGVMNYPFRNSVLAYLIERRAEQFMINMENLRENYPKTVFFSLMNIIGTHDTPRALTVLGVPHSAYEQSREGRANYAMSAGERDRAVSLLKIAAAIQYAFPGSPCVYYGDEAGMEGFEDPFNRRGYPWGFEDEFLVGWYRKLGEIRNNSEPMLSGDLRFIQAQGALLIFERYTPEERVVFAANSGDYPILADIDWRSGGVARDLLSGEMYAPDHGRLIFDVPARAAMLLSV